MSQIYTGLCKLLNVDTPIVAAPMAGASGGSLAAHVSLGSGFGFMAAGYDTLSQFEHQISLAREILQHPLEKASPLPIGVGFLGWQLEKKDSPAAHLVPAALKHNVQAVWFSFGNNLGHWIQLVRDFEVANNSERKTTIFVLVSSVQEAVTAIHDLKADVIVAQGIESGGHGHSEAPPLAQLTAEIVALEKPKNCLILAAGGISNGKEIADYIMNRGCAGVVLGTRFLLTPQALYSTSQKNALLAAKGPSDTVRTYAFDHLRGTTGWPDKVDGRGLYNQSVKEFDENGLNDEIVAKFKQGSQQGDPDRMLVWAGTGVGAMSAIQDAKEIIAELRVQCLEAFSANTS